MSKAMIKNAESTWCARSSGRVMFPRFDRLTGGGLTRNKRDSERRGKPAGGPKTHLELQSFRLQGVSEGVSSSISVFLHIRLPLVALPLFLLSAAKTQTGIEKKAL